MNIIVVENSKMLRQSFIKMLTTLGHSAKGAATAQQAIELLDSNSTDVLLLNPDLPGNSGIELLCEVQSYEDFMNVKSVLMVGRPKSYSRHGSSLKELGVELVIDIKTIDHDCLESALEHIELQLA